MKRGCVKRAGRQRGVVRGVLALAALLTVWCAPVALGRVQDAGSAGSGGSGGSGEGDPVAQPIEDLSTGSEGSRKKTGKERPEDPLVTIDWGLASSIPARRWIPVRVSLTGGLEAFTGVVEFRYRGDSTQSMSVSVPVAATPGKTSMYTPVISYPGAGDGLEVVLTTRSGRVVHRLKYSSNPSDVEIQLPSVRGDADPLIVAIGPANSGAASAVSLRTTAVPSRVNSSQNLAIDAVTADAASLPTIATAYDAASVVVVQSDLVRTIDPRALAALREWVAQGGWLVVVATSGDDTWSQWVARGAGTLLEVAEPTGEEMAPALARVVVMDVRLDKGLLTGRFPNSPAEGWREAPRWMHGPSVAESTRVPEVKAAEPESEGTPVDQEIEPATRVTARWIRLTDVGRSAGWRLGLLRRDPSPAPEIGPTSAWTEGSEDEGLMAQGPVGFGWVTVLGFDPRRASAQVSNRASVRVWAMVFGLRDADAAPGKAMTRVLRGAPPPLVSGWNPWGQTANSAMTLALDAVASAEAPGRSVFLLVALAAGMVPVLIGPVDYFVLRRMRRAHRSWLTALGWITLASVAAWGVPLVVRSSTTTVSRLSTVDVMMPPDAGSGAEPLAVSTGVTGVFVAGSVQATLTGLPARASVRGVASEVVGYGGTSDTPPAGELPVAQISPGLENTDEGADPWGGYAPRPQASAAASGEEFGDRALATVWRLWTFRAVEDRARIHGAVGATIEPGADGKGVRVSVTGLEPGAEIRSAAVVTGGMWYELKVKGGHSDAGRTFESGLVIERATWEPRPVVKVEYGYPYTEMKLGATLDATPGAALLLPGAYERGDQMDSFLGSGAWDAVYLHVVGLTPTVSLDTGSINREQAVYRIVIPHPPRSPVTESAPQDAPR